METMRRFLVLTPVAFGVTVVAAVFYMTVGVGGFSLDELGLAVLFVVGVVVVVLAMVLAAVGMLRLLRVRSAWAALGLAFIVVAVGCVLRYVADVPWVHDDEEWDLLMLTVASAASLPVWLVYATGLAIGGPGPRRDRAAQDRAVSPTA
jgi:hypothetical protein